MTTTPPLASASSIPTGAARALGAFYALITTALAALCAVAVTALAHGRDVEGVSLLGLVVLARGVAVAALDEWSLASTNRLRRRWRHELLSFLTIPRAEGLRARGDLALAVERASESPALERLRVSAATSLLGLVVVFLAAGWLPLVVTLALLGAAVPLYRRAGVRAEVLTASYQERRARLERRQLELLQRAPELRALGAVEYGAREIQAVSDSEHALALRAIRVALESSLVTEFLSGVSIGLVAMIVGFGLLDGRVSLTRALIAVLVTSELFTHVRRFGVEFHRRDDAEHARDVLRATPVAETSPDADALLSARRLVTEASEVALDFDVRAGDRVLVSGPSGSGKTTLLHTLLGWRAPLEGDVARGAGWIGHVGVESPLFTGTLRDNLTLGAPYGDDEVREHLRELGLDGVRFGDLEVVLLPDGRGLSTGERVRLVLARALLRDVALLVLDDVAGVLDVDARAAVTAALDARTDLAVVEASADSPLLARPHRRVEVGA